MNKEFKMDKQFVESALGLNRGSTATETKQKHSIGVNRGGGYWCAACGDITGPCEHFPAPLKAAPAMLAALERLTAVIRDVRDVYNVAAADWIMCGGAYVDAERAIKLAKGESR